MSLLEAIQMHRNYDLTTFIIIILIIFLVVISLTIKIIIMHHLRKQFLIEIERSEGSEKRIWQRKLRKLYIETIPLFGKLITKFIYK